MAQAQALACLSPGGACPRPSRIASGFHDGTCELMRVRLYMLFVRLRINTHIAHHDTRIVALHAFPSLLQTSALARAGSEPFVTRLNLALPLDTDPGHSAQPLLSPFIAPYQSPEYKGRA